MYFWKKSGVHGRRTTYYNLFIMNFIHKLLNNKALTFKLLILAASFLNLTYMHCQILHVHSFISYIYNPVNITFTLFDLCIIYFLPFLFINKRLHLIAIIYFLLTLIVWINVGYSRYFDDYLPVGLYTQIQNLNGLSNNVIDAIQYPDILLGLTSSIIVIYYFYFRQHFPISSRYASLFLLLTLLPTGSIALSRLLKTAYSNQRHFAELNVKKSIPAHVKDIIYAEHQIVSHKSSYYNYGLIINIFIEIWDGYHTDTSTDLKEIKPYIYAKKPALLSAPDTSPNIIIILAESLSSFPIGLTFNGIEITPTLNRLQEEGCYYPFMVSQTQYGESSDGQFIYLNGLLPLAKEVTINKIANNTLLSFPKLLKQKDYRYTTHMVIPTHENMWGQKKLCETYGIDSLYSRSHYTKEAEAWLNDQQLFELAEEKDNIQGQPFLSILLTSSTHSPYNRYFEQTDIQFPSDYSTELKIYLANVHYMDKYLGKYLESLKNKNLYENSLIIIVADHKPNAPKLNLKNKHVCQHIPLLILHSPMPLRTGLQDTIYQTTLFPTLLDLTGIPISWRGVGQSLMCSDSLKHTPFEQARISKAQRISEHLIYSDYFKSHNE